MSEELFVAESRHGPPHNINKKGTESTGWPNWPCLTMALSCPSQVFVKEGTLMKVSRKSRQPRHLFLVNTPSSFTSNALFFLNNGTI